MYGPMKNVKEANKAGHTWKFSVFSCDHTNNPLKAVVNRDYNYLPMLKRCNLQQKKEVNCRA